MDDYNLAPGELVILQNDGVWLGAGDDAEDLDEVVLTNQNLILVATISEGLFRSRRYLKRCPLDDIAATGDVPQAIAAQASGKSVLRVAFMDETITLRFKENERAAAERWAESIRRAAAGNVDAIDTNDVHGGTASANSDFVDGLAGAAAVAGAVGSIFGHGAVRDVASIVGSVGNAVNNSKRGSAKGAAAIVDAVGDAMAKSKGTPEDKETAARKERMSARTVAKCPGCHAPITGRVGNGATCPYCDTKFVL